MIHPHGDPTQGIGGVGTRARADYAACLMRDGTITPRVKAVFPSGFSLKSPTQGQGDSLGQKTAQQFMNYLLPQFVDEVEVYDKPLSWGTLGDIRAAIKVMKEMGCHRAHFYMVTDPCHMRRVMQVWECLCPEKWTASYHPAAKHVMSPFERLIREPIARMDYRRRLFSH